MNISLSEKLAPKLRMLREINNYTQDYVASVLEISPNTYSLMEKGQATFSLDRIERLANLYKMDIGDFLRINDQTIIHHIEHSSSIGNENVINNNGIADEERQMYKDVINRLEQQNDKLMMLIDKLSDKLS